MKSITVYIPVILKQGLSHHRLNSEKKVSFPFELEFRMGWMRAALQNWVGTKTDKPKTINILLVQPKEQQ